MQITSNAFTEGGNIPARFTCDGDDISPELAWSGLPAGTRTLILICDDPDAPGGTWDHWVMFNIPAAVAGLPEDAKRQEVSGQGSVEGTNSWGKTGYGGPCPPAGTHRYYFKLYALDSALTLDSTAAKKDVEQAMEGHVLGQAQIMGRYSRR
ncbi:MAG: YbhB/YbcL family Raf kinase inhibitor-like protein [Candidatus Marinimicrobia bacterium]|nr:YbhB/YbcL family Raf kinase inhibitor-like protein [Candidatus Neomarinimicrobiota bacterium]